MLGLQGYLFCWMDNRIKIDCKEKIQTLFSDGDLSPAERGMAQIFDTEVGKSFSRLLFLLSRGNSRIIFVIRRGFGVRRGRWLGSRGITSGAHRWLMQALREPADRKTHSSLLSVLISGELNQRFPDLMAKQHINKWHLHWYHIHFDSNKSSND